MPMDGKIGKTSDPNYKIRRPQGTRRNNPRNSGDNKNYTSRLPKSGETLRGSNFVSGFGGKGCNQCVAAKKLGANCLLVARIGNDFFGKNYYDRLLEYKISRKFVKITEEVSTGMAQITVASTGENQIVIVPGANDHLNEKDVEEAAQAIANCKVLICQLEVPESTTIEALRIKASVKTGKSILNAAPAPSRAELNPQLLILPDIFCVNETEAEMITEIPVRNPETAKEAVKCLLSKGCKEVIITLGEEGSVYGKADCEEFIHVPAVPVKAVDTTGAGDAFVGALAFLLATQPNLSMQDMLKKANIVSAVSVQREGTQDSFPLICELPKGFDCA